LGIYEKYSAKQRRELAEKGIIVRVLGFIPGVSCKGKEPFLKSKKCKELCTGQMGIEKSTRLTAPCRHVLKIYPS
jgi:hypothetical protein